MVPRFALLSAPHIVGFAAMLQMESFAYAGLDRNVIVDSPLDAIEGKSHRADIDSH